jgi:UDP-N-acetylglucosamine diphosphorylase/glucosamine-1-phosphate N-acetyltransferase
MELPDVILFDDHLREQLYPFTFTKPAAFLRTGIQTNVERWTHFLSKPVQHLTVDYLQAKYDGSNQHPALYVNGRYLATDSLMEEASSLHINQAIFQDDTLLAFYSDGLHSSFQDLFSQAQTAEQKISAAVFPNISRPWHLFSLCDKMIRSDYNRLTAGKISQPYDDSNTIIGSDIFLEEGVTMNAAIINTTSGPVYLGKDTEVMEGSMIRGPFSLGTGSTVKMGAKMYGASVIGPHCKVGGEINNSVISGYSNKAHDGFLGNSVIGEWCNLGADTNNSNLKNNYAEVRLYDYVTEKFIPTGLQFCGLMMGDHSKCGINTMFNTGTVVGVNANIFGDGFPRNFIPSFSWGGAAGFSTYKLTDALAVAKTVMQRRNITMSQADIDLLSFLFEKTSSNRK